MKQGHATETTPGFAISTGDTTYQPHERTAWEHEYQALGRGKRVSTEVMVMVTQLGWAEHGVGDNKQTHNSSHVVRL